MAGFPSDDDYDNDDEESNNGDDLAFDKYTVSESESANEWIYSLLWKCFLLVPECFSNSTV